MREWGFCCLAVGASALAASGGGKFAQSSASAAQLEASAMSEAQQLVGAEGMARARHFYAVLSGMRQLVNRSLSEASPKERAMQMMTGERASSASNPDDWIKFFLPIWDMFMTVTTNKPSHSGSLQVYNPFSRLYWVFEVFALYLVYFFKLEWPLLMRKSFTLTCEWLWDLQWFGIRNQMQFCDPNWHAPVMEKTDFDKMVTDAVSGAKGTFR